MFVPHNGRRCCWSCFRHQLRRPRDLWLFRDFLARSRCSDHPPLPAVHLLLHEQRTSCLHPYIERKLGFSLAGCQCFLRTFLQWWKSRRYKNSISRISFKRAINVRGILKSVFSFSKCMRRRRDSGIYKEKRRKDTSWFQTMQRQQLAYFGVTRELTAGIW